MSDPVRTEQRGHVLEVTLDRPKVERYAFPDLKTLLAKASPARAGDNLAGIAAQSAQERVAAQMALAEVPLKTFLTEHVVPYEQDDVTRLIIKTHDAAAFARLRRVGQARFIEWVRSLARARSFAWFEPTDPGPFLRASWHLFALALRRIMGRFA